MTKTREQSAVDAIYEALEELKELKKQIKMIDSNVKLLNNKVLKISEAINKLEASPIAAAQPKPSAIPITTSTPQLETLDSVKVFGRIKNAQKKPMENVKVNLFSARGELIKSRKTDSDGYWEARVPPGSYVIEYDPTDLSPNLKPVNINAIIDKSLQEYEVKAK